MGELRRRPVRLIKLASGLALLALTLAAVGLASGEGSGTIYRVDDPEPFRSNIEWRTSSYGGGDSPEFVLRRRTLLKVYAQQGEAILTGSSGIDVGEGVEPNAGDIRIFVPGAVTGSIGQETIPELQPAPGGSPPGVFANGFSCLAQRDAAGDGRGRISSRDQELAGPLPNTGGYAPCVYIAPVTGIYSVIFSGPSGADSDEEPTISGQLNPTPADFGPLQATSVTAWDVTVRSEGGNGPTRPGRLFAYYFAANTGGNGRPIGGDAFTVTDTGFRYRISISGDPYGFLFFANRRGFQNTDGTALYRTLMADPRAGTQDQNQLRELQGNVRLLPPQFPLFVSEPDPLVLTALGIPLTPIPPTLTGFTFQGARGDDSTSVDAGGVFSFTSTQPGAFAIVVSRDGTNFDPTEPRNRVLRGEATAGVPMSVTWDGRDNSGEPFPLGDYRALAAVKGGEIHFPFLDVENNLSGGPVIQLENPPDLNADGTGDCPPWAGACFGAFYDDRGYRTAAGTLVGQAVNGNLCPGDANNPRGFGNPPLLGASDQSIGFDSRSRQRAFGFDSGGNPGSICVQDSGFGDKKGLDLWTFYPSNIQNAPLRIIDATAVTLRRLTAARSGVGVEVRWETGVELGTAGFHLLRSTTGTLADAVRVTPALIPARGGATEGAAYSWADATATDPAATYSYWLEEHEIGGATRLYGPVRSAPASAAGANTVMLPLVMR
jgi:hypothetical protein